MAKRRRNFEWFVASKMRLEDTDGVGSRQLRAAIVGISMSIAIMFLSLSIVEGFKMEVAMRIYSLAPHISITPSGDSPSPLPVTPIYNIIRDIPGVKNVTATTDINAMLKTDSCFEAVMLHAPANQKYPSACALIEGTLPDSTNSDTYQVAISASTASAMHLHAGDNLLAYFAGNGVKVRRVTICGIFSTGFSEYDHDVALASPKLIESITDWTPDLASSISVTLDSPESQESLDSITSEIASRLQTIALIESQPIRITTVRNNYASYFAWLDLLDLNTAVILILMALVTAFTLIAALVVIILNNIRNIGILKAIGTSNGSVRRIFIMLTQKLIFRAMLWGNLIPLILVILQRQFKFIPLNPEVYYISFVPMNLNLITILIMNLAVIVLSLVALILPSVVITNISPSKSLKWE